jgi:RimJ/RimL family protein N-acetyltransferase
MQTTNRLTLRPFDLTDAAFVVELLNDPGWLRFIGDRNVRTLADARQYIETKLLAQQRRLGYSLMRVADRGNDTPLGMCGLVRREGLDDADIGFALLARHRGKGYALEAARAVLHMADNDLNIERVVGICDPNNVASIRLLETLGFAFETRLRLPHDETELKLFARHRHAPAQ